VLTQGSRDQIARQAAEIVEAARDGGVIIGTHSIDSDIPVENYDFYHSTLRRLDETF